MALRRFCGILLFGALNACAFVPQSGHYRGPPPRPPELETLYAKGAPLRAIEETHRGSRDGYEILRIVAQSDAGPITIDFYRQNRATSELILVFPVLGGSNFIAEYFAEYFVEHGFDSAIVHRVDDFKNPAHFYKLEELLRQNVVRDRLALDLFEQRYGKRKFGSFGISRGAINVATTAGVDGRLRYNVLAMGGSDLPGMFAASTERGIHRYRARVLAAHAISEVEFDRELRTQIHTDPKNLARYMDARDTLMVLALFDHAVPFRFGRKLWHEIGGPSTVYVAAGHVTSALYTRMAKELVDELEALPIDYIEREALAFYRRKLRNESSTLQTLLYRLFQAPLSVLGAALTLD